MSSGHYKFDLFLRYHRAQARWARQLAERLDREDFKVWFDRWMLQPGDDRRLELQLAIEQCRWIGVVASPEFVANPWPRDELYSGFSHAPPRQNQRLLTLLHTPAELPRPLAEAPLLDFSGSEEDPVLFEYRARELMHFLDPSFPTPGDLQRFRLQYHRREEPPEDEEVRGFQAFLRAIQLAILRIATGEMPSATPEEGARKIAILQFLQRLFQWNSADIQFDRAEEWRKRGNLTEALAAYDRALNMDPNFALAWSRRGDVLVQLARYREAVDSYNGSLSINPYDEETRLRLALILGRLGQYKAAVVNYDKVLESNPEDALAWHNRGIRLMQLKRPKLALNSLNKALRYNPQQPRTWLARGIVLRRLRRPSSAAASFARVLKLNPRSGRVWRYQGNALFHCQRLRSAIECYKRSLRLRRRDPITLHNLGVALLRLGQYRLARKA
ncbi:tetratricopeptide repeat protein, partial [Synechococcus sp. OH2]|uniref:tetratricopeptide repeat protein n=1 Tax=Synechococcus sp. OH2 TaxID=136798 RepID=UPI0039C23BEE